MKLTVPLPYILVMGYVMYIRFSIETQICFGAYKDQYLETHDKNTPYRCSYLLRTTFDIMLVLELIVMLV